MKNSAGYIGYQLRELNTSGVIASVFSDPQNPDDFIAGYVRGINARSTLIESITPYGRFDGWFAIRLSSIVEVMNDATYAARLELLLKIHGEEPTGMFEQSDEDFIVLLLKYAEANQRVVTIWTHTDAYTGFIQSLDDLRVTIGSLDFMGESLGPVPIRLTDIDLISLGSEEERMNEVLSEHLRKDAPHSPNE